MAARAARPPIRCSSSLSCHALGGVLSAPDSPRLAAGELCMIPKSCRLFGSHHARKTNRIESALASIYLGEEAPTVRCTAMAVQEHRQEIHEPSRLIRRLGQARSLLLVPALVF